MHQFCLSAAVTIILLGFNCWSVQSMRCELLSVKKGSKTNMLVNYTVRKVDLFRIKRPPMGFEDNITQLLINRVLNTTAVDHRIDPSSYLHQYDGNRHKALTEMRSKRNNSTNKRNKGMIRRRKYRRRGQRNKSTPRRNRGRDLLKVKSVECESTVQQGSACQPQPVKACLEEADNCINITCVCVYRPSVQIFNLGEVA